MSDSERDRYSRQILFAGIGAEGQQLIRQSLFIIVGCGALGTFQAGALARAGAGRLRLIDRDYVEWSNLQRQWLYEESDAEQALPKAIAASRAVNRINSTVAVEPVVADLTPDNAADLLTGATVILDATDNFETRYLINDFAVENGIPWVYGGAVSSQGVAMPVIASRGPCFECVYPSPPEGEQPSCETAGVLNTIPAMVAAWQVSIALRIAVGQGSEVPLRLTSFDVWSGVVRQLTLPERAPDCPACGLRTCRHLKGKNRAPISLCGRNAVQIHDRRKPIDLAALAVRLAPLGTVRANEFALRFSLPLYEITVFPDGRAIIKGTTDPGLARSLYSRYLGN